MKKHLNPDVEITVTDSAMVSDEEMQGFSYIEHKENVALALAVCASLGVKRETALEGMKRGLPDSGAMRIFYIRDRGKEIEVVNTLAANDPDSIRMLWELVKNRCGHKIILVNCRRDRADRSRQLAELIADWEKNFVVVTGGLTRAFFHRAVPAEDGRRRTGDGRRELTSAGRLNRNWFTPRSGK